MKFQRAFIQQIKNTTNKTEMNIQHFGFVRHHTDIKKKIRTRAIILTRA